MKGYKLSPIHLPPAVKVKAVTVKHSAAFLTFMGGISHYVHFLPELEVGLFVLAGVVAIYEPYLAAGEV